MWTVSKSWSYLPWHHLLVCRIPMLQRVSSMMWVSLNQFNISNIHVASSLSLASVFSEALLIASMLKKIQASRQQFAGLISSVEMLLQILESEYLADQLLEPQTSVSLKNLIWLHLRIYCLSQKQPTEQYFKLHSGTSCCWIYWIVFTERRKDCTDIENYYHWIKASVTSFQMCGLPQNELASYLLYYIFTHRSQHLLTFKIGSCTISRMIRSICMTGWTTWKGIKITWQKCLCILRPASHNTAMY